MSEFKFKCPACGQRMQIDASASGRTIDCPACKKRIVIPSLPKRRGEIALATLAPMAATAAKKPAPVPKREVAAPAPPGEKEMVTPMATARSKEPDKTPPAPPGRKPTVKVPATPEPPGRILPETSVPPKQLVKPPGKSPPPKPEAQPGPRPAMPVQVAPKTSAPPGEQGPAPLTAMPPSPRRAAPPSAPEPPKPPAAMPGKSKGEAKSIKAPTAAPALEASNAILAAGAVKAEGASAQARGPKVRIKAPAVAPAKETLKVAPEPEGRSGALISATPSPPAKKPSFAPDRPRPETAPAVESRVPEAESLEPRRPQIGALTPEIKLEIVQAVRRRIADKSRWLSGKTEPNDYVYAAKASGGELVTVDVTSPEATHFSLFGAVLREFDGRNVIKTAAGRRRFLDREIVEAIRQVLQSGPEGASKPPPSEKARKALSHAQCLAVLNLLEERYTTELQQVKAASAERKSEIMRLADLLEKLQKKSRVEPEEVAAVLCHELEEIKKRLSRLERGPVAAG